MDSKRFLLAVALMVTVLMITNILLPPARPPAGETAPIDSVSSPASGAPPAARPSTTPQLVPGDSATAPVATVPADTIAIRSPLYEYRVSTQGGALVGADLNAFESLRQDRAGQPVQLAPDSLPHLIRYRLRIGTREIDLANLPFTPNASGVIELPEGGSARTVELHSGGTGGANVALAYTFVPDDYIIDVRMAVTGVDGQTPQLFIGLPPRIAFNEAKPQDDQRSLALVVNSDREGVTTFRLNNIDRQPVVEGPLRWAAVKNKYFVTGLLMHPEAPTPFGGVVTRPLADLAADMQATLLPAEDGTFAFRLYVGPQEPQRLAVLGNSFEDVSAFGWQWLRPMLVPLGHAIQWAIYAMHDALGIGYGWVLILFGVIIRALMWPLNAKAMRSQMKNMEIQPLMKEIQAKYKDNPQRLQEEMMKLYKEKGFNPMGGCLPMLIPMPILFALFYVLQAAIAFRGEGFLWLPDLSQKDPYYILPVVMGASIFLTQWLSMRGQVDQNPQMKMMMYIMPPMMTFFFLNFASGLNLYYSAMNFASIPQTLQIAKERSKLQANRPPAATAAQKTR